MPRKLISLASVILIVTSLVYVTHYQQTLTFDPITYHAVLHVQNFPDEQVRRLEVIHTVHTCLHAIQTKLEDFGYSKPRNHSCVYPKRNDQLFITHAHDTIGSYTVHLPRKLSFELFCTMAQPVFQDAGLVVTITAEKRVEIASPHVGFEGTSLTAQDVRDIRAGNIAQKYTDCAPYLDWQWKHPFVGAQLSTDAIASVIPRFAQPVSWNFSLQQLAPGQGKGVHIAVIDTGAAGLQVNEYAGTYRKNQDINLPNDFSQYGYNLVSEHGLDPILQVALAAKPLLEPSLWNVPELLRNIPHWILDYRIKGDTSQIQSYFEKKFKNEFLDKKGILNENGKASFEKFITSQFSNSLFATNGKIFDVVTLPTRNNEHALLQTLPLPQITASPQTYIAGHGTCTYGMVNGAGKQGGVAGLAPQATVHMLKAFSDDGKTTKSTLVTALQQAHMMGCDVVNMSLKIADQVNLEDADIQDLRQSIESIPYVVAASGNGAQSERQKASPTESYPARFGAVAFDVGAFAWDAQSNSVDVCDFSQYEPNIGPKVVAPGFNILGPGLVPDQQQDSMYVFMDGTSISAPIVTGFLGLVLGEFGALFTRKQILKTVYANTIVHDSSWKQKSLLGAIDMRSALLCLHCLKYIQKRVGAKEFQNHFDQFLQACKHCVLSPTKQISDSFTQDFATFLQDCKQAAVVNPEHIFGTDLTDITKNIGNVVLSAYHQQKPDLPRFKALHKEVSLLFTQKKSLFVANVAQHINLVLQHAK